MERRVRRNRKGTFDLALPEEERELLRSLPASVGEAFADLDPRQTGDPATARLFPSAYLEDAESDRDFRRLTQDDLISGRRQALETFGKGIDSKVLAEDEVLAWLRAINDIRLLLGTRIGITDDDAGWDFDPHDPRAPALGVYHYLGALQEELVEAVSS